MIHGAGEMLVEDQRYARGLAEAAVGEADAIGLDELRGCGLMSVGRHIDEQASPSAIEKKSGMRQKAIRVLKVPP
jgi:hypothetical protein